MKKTIALLLAFTTVLCLALAGCGQADDEPEANAVEQSSAADNAGGTDQSAEKSYAEQAEEDLKSTSSSENNDAPKSSVSSGYQLVDNQLFAAEVPTDWKVQSGTLQNFYVIIEQPHKADEMYCTITVTDGGPTVETVEEMYQGYDPSLGVQYYDVTVDGQPAKVIERGGGGVTNSAFRNFYGYKPDGGRFKIEFACPSYEHLDFSAIQPAMDHFMETFRFQ